MVWSLHGGLTLLSTRHPTPRVSLLLRCLHTLSRVTRVLDFASGGNRWHYSLGILFFLPKPGKGISRIGAKGTFWISCCSLPSGFISHSDIVFYQWSRPRLWPSLQVLQFLVSVLLSVFNNTAIAMAVSSFLSAGLLWPLLSLSLLATSTK